MPTRQSCRSGANQLTPSLKREGELVFLLLCYIAVGLLFMLVPGTLLGVWNLLDISTAHASNSAQPAWIQAHGHAQLFGWVLTFILGIGFYVLPNYRRVASSRFVEGWLCLFLWSTGVFLRWAVTIWSWHWRLLLPLSAVLELGAALVFVYTCFKAHSLEKSGKERLAPPALSIIAGTFGLLLTEFLNLRQVMWLVKSSSGPLLPSDEARLLVNACIWGSIIPVVWGLAGKWMPSFLRLRAARHGLFLVGIGLNYAGLALSLSGHTLAGSGLLCGGAISVIAALRLFEPPAGPARVAGVHTTFPLFIRLAFGWLLLSSFLAAWYSMQPQLIGVFGASRHAVTVGFMSTMIFAVAPRVLPAFLSRAEIYSKRLMFVALLLLNLGCLTRVVSQIVAYQDWMPVAWVILPISAVIELLAVSIFAFNMVKTLGLPTFLDKMKAAESSS